MLGYYFYEKKSTNNVVEPNFLTDISTAPEYKFGYNVADYQFDTFTIKKNQFLADILVPYGVPYPTIHQVAEKAKDVWPVRDLRVNKPYCMITDSCDQAEAFIYFPNSYRYIHYNVNKDSSYVKMIEHPVDKKVVKGTGVLRSSLWNSMLDADLSPVLISRMEDALAWSIDFHHAQTGDQYKLLYEKETIEGKEVGIGRLLGAYYKNYDNEYYAIWYDDDEYSGFYDLTGRPTKKTFLRAPVKFSRVSSGYSLRRYHPVLKRVKPHFGTDYAAPRGTPIISVANGVVTHVAFTRGNGKYVKIKHNKTYQTQYLHMSRFAKGIKPGVHVKQGQVIGYVGSTGLATGPHVCFRFWKNGKQINHRKLNFPPAEPMPEDQLPAFYAYRDSVVQVLNNIPLTSLEIEPREVIKPDTTEIP